MLVVRLSDAPRYMPYYTVAVLVKVDVSMEKMIPVCRALHEKLFDETYEFDLRADNGIYVFCSDEEGFENILEIYEVGHAIESDFDNYGYPLKVDRGIYYEYTSNRKIRKIGDFIRSTLAKTSTRGRILDI